MWAHFLFSVSFNFFRVEDITSPSPSLIVFLACFLPKSFELYSQSLCPVSLVRAQAYWQAYSIGA
jgi:hypothetical protein